MDPRARLATFEDADGAAEKMSGISSVHVVGRRNMEGQSIPVRTGDSMSGEVSTRPRVMLRGPRNGRRSRTRAPLMRIVHAGADANATKLASEVIRSIEPRFSSMCRASSRTMLRATPD